MGHPHTVTWRLRSRTLDNRDHTLVMGILNVTPDSFSDGGAYDDLADAIDHARRLVADGADIVDVGGESTRPGAAPVPVDVELARVIPVVETLAAEGIVVSIDTSKAEVARRAVDAGAEIVNDVTGLRDPAMVAACVEAGPGVVIMHMQGEPRTMQADPTYDDVVVDIRRELLGRVAAFADAGGDPAAVCLDPGIGFGKTIEHNLELLRRLDAFVALGHPVLIGTSRKSFIGAVLDAAGRPTAPDQRDVASAATAALSAAAGAAVVRAHDVRATLEATRIADAIVRSASQQT